MWILITMEMREFTHEYIFQRENITVINLPAINTKTMAVWILRPDSE